MLGSRYIHYFQMHQFQIQKQNFDKMQLAFLMESQKSEVIEKWSACKKETKWKFKSTHGQRNITLHGLVPDSHFLQLIISRLILVPIKPKIRVKFNNIFPFKKNISIYINIDIVTLYFFFLSLCLYVFLSLFDVRDKAFLLCYVWK